MDEKDAAARPSTILESLSQLLNHEKFSDVKFIVGDEEEIVRASRNLLSLRSPVLESLLYPSTDSPVVISDVAAHAFELMLRYCYTDSTNDINESNVMEVLFCADKYQISPLTKICAAFVREKLNAENVSEFLAFSHVPTDLEQQCLGFFKRNAEICLESSTFSQLPKKYLLKLVESDELVVGQEIKVLRACVRWAQAQTPKDDSEDLDDEETPPLDEENSDGEELTGDEPGLDEPGSPPAASRKQKEESKTSPEAKEILGDVVPLIRFPLMDSGELLGEVQASGLLNSDQLLQIITFVSFSKETESEFPTTPRLKLRPVRGKAKAKQRANRSKPQEQPKQRTRAVKPQEPTRKPSDDVPQLESIDKFGLLSAEMSDEGAEMKPKRKPKPKKSLSSAAERSLFGNDDKGSSLFGSTSFDDHDLFSTK